jgi:DNA-binding transcriptional LysR family regulator
VVESLADSSPRVEILIDEGEPHEAIEKLHGDRADLAVVYDYTMNPHTFPGTSMTLLGREPVDVAIPRRLAGRLGRGARTVRADQLSKLADVPWISNSRSREDDELISRLSGLGGFAPSIGHRVDSIGLITRLVADGLGVALIPRLARPAEEDPALSYFEVADPPVRRRFYALTRAGSGEWPPLDLVRRELAARCVALGMD